MSGNNPNKDDLEKWHLMHMTKMAESAAARAVGIPESSRHVETLEAGEQVFHVTFRERTASGHRASSASRRAVVTINPNGRKATVEWPNARTGQMNYRVCDLHSMSTTSEEPAIGE